MDHLMRRLFLALVAALLAFAPAAADAQARRVLPAPQIDGSGNLTFPGGPTLGRYQGGVYAPTAPAQPANDNSDKAAATSYVDTAIGRTTVTRAQIATTSISPLVGAFVSAGHGASGDRGAGCLYVRGASSGPGAVQDALGTWWQHPSGKPLDASCFGAKGDDATDDTAALTAAINALNTRCGRLRIPAGTYRFSSLPTITCSLGGIVEGEGPGGATKLRHTATSGNSLTNVGSEMEIRDLTFLPVNTKTSGFELRLANCFHCRAANIRIDNAYGGIDADTVTLAEVDSINIRYPVGPYGILFRGTSDAARGNGMTLSRVVTDAPYPVSGIAWNQAKTWTASTAYNLADVVRVNGYIWQATQAGTSASSGTGPANPIKTTSGSLFDPANDRVDGTVKWRFVANGGLTWVVQESYADSLTMMNVRLLNGYRGYLMNDSAGTATSGSYWTYIFNLEIDHPFETGALLNGGLGFHVTKSWFGSSLTDRNLKINSTFKGEATVSGSRFVGASMQGVIVFAGPTDIIFDGNIVAMNNQFNGPYPGIEFLAGATRFQVNNNRVGNLAGFGPFNAQNYGIVVGNGASDHYTITGNLTSGNTVGGVFDGGTGTNKVVSNAN